MKRKISIIQIIMLISTIIIWFLWDTLIPRDIALVVLWVAFVFIYTFIIYLEIVKRRL